MWFEGTFNEKMVGRFKESICLVLLGTGFVLLFFLINQSIFFEPTDMQNLILLMIGSFGSYVFLMDLFFEDDRKSIMQRHLLGVVGILLFLGALSVINTASKGIQLENMPTELPLFDSAIFLFLFFFLVFFTFFFIVDGIIIFVKKVKESQSVIRNETTESDDFEEEE